MLVLVLVSSRIRSYTVPSVLDRDMAFLAGPFPIEAGGHVVGDTRYNNNNNLSTDGRRPRTEEDSQAMPFNAVASQWKAATHTRLHIYPAPLSSRLHRLLLPSHKRMTTYI